MLTLTSRYALHALVHFVRHFNGERMSARRIADEAKIPPKYLSAILTELVHGGILESLRGKGGGFVMGRPPDEITLYEVIYPFEPQFRAKRLCPFGNDECSDENPCVIHAEWKKMIEAERQFLEAKTLADIAAGPANPIRRHRSKGSTNAKQTEETTPNKRTKSKSVHR